MGTTSAVLALELLDCVHASGIEYALLHNEPAVARGHIPSDVDIVVDADPPSVIARLASILGPARAAPLILWNYDVNSWTSFWFSPDLTQGVQLDLLHDPRGRAKYGLRTGEALRTRVLGERYWTLDPVSAAAYLVSKRAFKGDGDRLRAAVGALLSSPTWRTDLARVISSHRRADLRRYLPDNAAPPPTTPYLPWPAQPLVAALRPRVIKLARLAARMRTPIGFVIVLPDGGDQAGECLDLITPVLPPRRPTSGTRRPVPAAGLTQLAALHREIRRPAVITVQNRDYSPLARLLSPSKRVIDLSALPQTAHATTFYTKARLP